MKNLYICLLCLGIFVSGNVGAQTIFSENFENVANNALPTGWQGTTQAGTGGTWKTGTYADFFVPGFGRPLPHTRFIGLVTDTSLQYIPRTDILTLPLIPLQNPYTYTTLTLQTDLFFIGIDNSCVLEMSFDTGNVWTQAQVVPFASWGPRFFVLPAIVNKPSIMLRFKHTCPAGAIFCGFDIDNVSLYVPAAVDAAMYDVTPHADGYLNYASAGQGLTVRATVLNRAFQALDDLVLKYRLGNGPVFADTFTNLAIQNFGTGIVTHNIPCTVPSVANYPLTVWIETLGDGDHNNDTGTTTVFGAAFMPVKIPVIEERGGTWCGWCIRGLFFNDSLSQVHPEASIISVHNNGPAPDPMAIPVYDTFMGHMHINDVDVSAYGFPITITDRRFIDDPENTVHNYERFSPYFGFGSLTLGDAIINNNDLSINVKFRPAINLSGEYRLALVLTEDSVHKDSMFYDQTNSYSYMMQNMFFHGYETLPSPIPAVDMYYDFVARSILDDPGGTAGSLPAQMNYNSDYSHTFHTTLGPEWHKERMKAVAMLIRSSDTFILNSANRPLITPLLAGTPGLKSAFALFPNPASGLVYAHVSFNKETAYSLQLSDMAGRMVFSKEYKPAISETIAVPVKSLANGIYNLQLRTAGGETINKLLSVSQ